MTLELVLFSFLLILSAFFSGSETAFFSIRKEKLNADIKSHKAIISLINNPRILLITLLIGNLVVNIIASAIAADLVIRYLQRNQMVPELALVISPFIMTAILLIFGEITPKTIAIRYNIPLSRFSLPAISTLIKVFSPFIKVIYFINNIFVSVFVKIFRLQKINITDEEIKSAVELGDIPEEEASFIKNIVDLEDRTASQIMIPRLDIAAIEVNKSFEEVQQIIKETNASRYPVYEESIDRIIGILYVKDVLQFIVSPAGFSIKKILKHAYFVPETKRIDDLLYEMRNKKIHISICIDEFGGTAGLITLEDILEEIFGEIEDEHDFEDTPAENINDKGEITVEASIAIHELKDDYSVELPENNEYDTLGGFIYCTLDRIPKPGEVIETDEYYIEIIDMDQNRILNVKIIKKDNKDDSDS